MRITVAVEKEPYPKSPIGISAALKLEDWLALSDELKDSVDINVVPLDEIGADIPDIVEAFANRAELLRPDTVPTITEHEILMDIRKYWSAVEQSRVPAIPIYPEGFKPDSYPVFVRGRNASFTSGGCADSRKKFEAFGKNCKIVARPFVDIKPCVSRKKVTRELRAHVVRGRCACVEFLFPPWASVKPTHDELQAGWKWTESISKDAAGWSETIAEYLGCGWFSADFCETTNGPALIELNPGWCSGITHKLSARSIHTSILSYVFKINMPSGVWAYAADGVPYVVKNSLK
jgi:hypothetical protein